MKMFKKLRTTIFALIILMMSCGAYAANWKSKTYKDEMSGVAKVQKVCVATDGDVTLVAQISGYGQNDNLVWGYSKSMLDLHWQHDNLRVKVDGRLYWFGTKRTGKDFREFIFSYACEAESGPDYGCAKEKESTDYLIQNDRLLNLLLEAKEIKLELPFYKRGNVIKTFK